MGIGIPLGTGRHRFAHAIGQHFRDLERTCRELTAMTREQRDALGVMHPGRGDVIGGGALVWRRVLQRIAEATDGRVSTATTSEHDILDGIALSRLSTIPQKAPLA